ncbi:MAG: hypothetical protein KA226_03420 [Gemmatimonadales bacterium]|jgi:hypothetical protein|nr:hypothetical protein [Gemmatimonadales bacterium]MBP7619510.1 hypothetical protein [Gemmatimonadales bacterium]
MIPAGLGPIGPAIVARKRRQLIATFRTHGATSPASARTLKELGLGHGMLVRIQEHRQVLVEVGEGRFYLDEAREAAVSRTRRLMLGAVVLVVAIGAMLLSQWG